jgi:S-formylglutathione hydrolase FrmB
MKVARSVSLLLVFVCVLAMALILIRFLGRQTSVPIVDHPQLARGVILRDITFYSQALNRDMQYRALMPETASDRKLPVVYLLHGGGGSFRDWSNYTDVAQFAADGLILVMPEGNSSYYVNAVSRPADRYEDYVVNDLRADVERRFPARSDREG